jgi:hypothetical protein
MIPGASEALATTGELAMRKVILFVQVSLDGFFEGPKKEIDWHMVDDELFAHVIEELKAMGAFLYGRNGRGRPWRDAPAVLNRGAVCLAHRRAAA